MRNKYKMNKGPSTYLKNDGFDDYSEAPREIS